MITTLILLNPKFTFWTLSIFLVFRQLNKPFIFYQNKRVYCNLLIVFLLKFRTKSMILLNQFFIKNHWQVCLCYFFHTVCIWTSERKIAVHNACFEWLLDTIWMEEVITVVKSLKGTFIESKTTNLAKNLLYWFRLIFNFYIFRHFLISLNLSIELIFLFIDQNGIYAIWFVELFVKILSDMIKIKICLILMF